MEVIQEIRDLILLIEEKLQELEALLTEDE